MDFLRNPYYDARQTRIEDIAYDARMKAQQNQSSYPSRQYSHTTYLYPDPERGKGRMQSEFGHCAGIWNDYYVEYNRREIPTIQSEISWIKVRIGYITRNPSFYGLRNQMVERFEELNKVLEMFYKNQINSVQVALPIPVNSYQRYPLFREELQKKSLTSAEKEKLNPKYDSPISLKVDKEVNINLINLD